MADGGRHADVSPAAGTNTETPSLAFWGSVLLVAGFVGIVYGFNMSGAAPDSETLNIGLLNDKQNVVLASGFASVVGAVFTAAEVRRAS